MMVYARANSTRTTVKVPKHYFERVLKPMGYELVETENDVLEIDETKEAVKHENSFEEDIMSMPLSEMNQKQLKTFARKKGIDISGTKSFSEAKEVIKKALSEM